jgi:3-methyladenine DNA glycosylase AlkC
MEAIPSLEGLGWSKVRAVARELAATGTPDEVAAIAERELGSEDTRRRMLAIYLLGFTAGARRANMKILRERAALDPSWEAQEALAQAFDAYCATMGYEAALPVIDAWLGDAHANARRAVSEGLRPWTSKSRRYFYERPDEAIQRLAGLRADESEYVRHSAGNALRDIRRAHQDLVDAETATWDTGDARVRFTYERVLKAR